MLKRIAAALIILGFGLALLARPAFTFPGDLNGDAEDVAEPIWPQTPEPNSEQAPEENPGGWGYSFLDRILGGILWGIGWAVNGLVPYSIDQLVFLGATETGGMGDAFTADEWQRLVLPWHNLVLAFSLSLVVVQIVVIAVGLSSVSPFKRSESWSGIMNLVVAAILVVSGPTILRVVLEINRALVGLVASGLQRFGVPLGTGLAISSVRTGSAILDGLVYIANAGLELYFNIIYLVRKFMLAIVLILWPLVAWSWVSRNTRQPFMLALSELVTNGLMTASHALAYGFFLTMLQLAGTGIMTRWWAKLAAFTLIIPVSAFIRRALIGWLDILGASEEKMAAAAAAGVGSILAVGSMVAGLVTPAKVRAPAAVASAATSTVGAAGGASPMPPQQELVAAVARTAVTPQALPQVAVTPVRGRIGFATPEPAPVPRRRPDVYQPWEITPDRLPPNPDINPDTVPPAPAPGVDPYSGTSRAARDNRARQELKQKVISGGAVALRLALGSTATALPMTAALMSAGAGPLGAQILDTSRSTSTALRRLADRIPKARRVSADETAAWRSAGHE